MERFVGYARLLSTGAPVASATIDVYDAGTANHTSIYSDNLATPTALANPFTTDTNGYFTFYAAKTRVDITISAGTPAIPTPYTWGDIAIGLGTNVRTGSKAWDPPNLADGAVASTSVTVTGARANDVCLAALSTLTTQSMTLTAHVSANDTTFVLLHNLNGGAVDLANGTLTVWAFNSAGTA